MQRGKAAEIELREIFKSFGKKAYLHKLADTGQVSGRARALGRKAVQIDAQPADNIGILNGEMFFAEVKDTSDTSFRRSDIRKSQWIGAIRTLAAGGAYYFFVRSPLQGWWYRVPASFIVGSPASKKSWPWAELEPFKWMPTNVQRRDGGPGDFGNEPRSDGDYSTLGRQVRHRNRSSVRR